jgi:hypothetical protein
MSTCDTHSQVDLKDKWRNLQHQAQNNDLTPDVRNKVIRVASKLLHEGAWEAGVQW